MGYDKARAPPPELVSDIIATHLRLTDDYNRRALHYDDVHLMHTMMVLLVYYFGSENAFC